MIVIQRASISLTYILAEATTPLADKENCDIHSFFKVKILSSKLSLFPTIP